MLRVAEMRESLKIIAQAMEKITDQGEIRAEAAGIIPPQREKMKTEMEALIYHFKIFTEGFSPPWRSLRYHRIAARRTRLLHRQRRLAKAAAMPLPFTSYINLQALPKIVEGQIIAASSPVSARLTSFLARWIANAHGNVFSAHGEI